MHIPCKKHKTEFFSFSQCSVACVLHGSIYRFVDVGLHIFAIHSIWVQDADPYIQPTASKFIFSELKYKQPFM